MHQEQVRALWYVRHSDEYMFRKNFVPNYAMIIALPYSTDIFITTPFCSSLGEAH
jgi:hypothetical protein